MRLIAQLAVSILLLLLLSGCDSKPKPAEVPKLQLEPPKNRPIPGGGGTKAPPQTGQIPLRMMDADGMV